VLIFEYFAYLSLTRRVSVLASSRATFVYPTHEKHPSTQRETPNSARPPSHDLSKNVSIDCSGASEPALISPKGFAGLRNLGKNPAVWTLSPTYQPIDRCSLCLDVKLIFANKGNHKSHNGKHQRLRREKGKHEEIRLLS
jgi:hypothetical protein